jgi:hypothetical protein
MPQFEKKPYSTLNAKQKELRNFHKIAAVLADYGFNCIKLADDWQGADFLAYRWDGKSTLKVQLKSRITIQKKYCGKDIWMAFPHGESWYLIKHDRLVEMVGEHTNWLNCECWKPENGFYHSVSINRSLLKELKENRLEPDCRPVLEEDDEPVFVGAV